MAGLYIHIPFCRSKCAYCDFFSMPVATMQKKYAGILDAYCDAVIKEFDIRKNEISAPVKTIYIGGGTPTAIPVCMLTGFISRLADHIGPSAEIEELTVEANPEDISMDTLDALKNVGVNRISIGIQSFDNNQLNAVERHHNAETSLQALDRLAASGINYSADLIYGLPGQSMESWRQQLDTLLGFNPPHFSAYMLSYEPGTRLYIRKEQGKVAEADEETAIMMYRHLISTAAERGYGHYEISNFSRPGHEAVHNSSYWNLTPYLGLGCSAHSFDGELRRINPTNIKRYLESILTKKTASFIIENETLMNRVNDYIITSLRTSRGISLDFVKERWGMNIFDSLRRNISVMENTGKLTLTSQGNYRIPEHYWLMSDAILRELILDSE